MLHRLTLPDGHYSTLLKGQSNWNIAPQFIGKIATVMPKPLQNDLYRYVQKLGYSFTPPSPLSREATTQIQFDLCNDENCLSCKSIS